MYFLTENLTILKTMLNFMFICIIIIHTRTGMLGPRPMGHMHMHFMIFSGPYMTFTVSLANNRSYSLNAPCHRRINSPKSSRNVYKLHMYIYARTCPAFVNVRTNSGTTWRCIVAFRNYFRESASDIYKITSRIT